MIYAAEYAFGDSTIMWQMICATEDEAQKQTAKYMLNQPWIWNLEGRDKKKAEKDFNVGNVKSVIDNAGLKGFRIRSMFPKGG